MAIDKSSSERWMETDVLVLGSGAAGCGAATAAREKGAKGANGSLMGVGGEYRFCHSVGGLEEGAGVVVVDERGSDVERVGDPEVVLGGVSVG